VFQDGGRQAGLVVDRILDIVEETVTVRQRSIRTGLLGSAVVGKQVTAFIDVKAVLTSAFTDWFQNGGQPRSGRDLLLAEGSPFVRGILRVELETAGYRVHEAEDAEAALEWLHRGPVDLILTAVDLPESGFSRVLQAAKGATAASRIPVIALTETTDPSQPEHYRADDHQNKFDRTSMLHSIGRLAAVVAAEREAVAETV
jgi:two-component system chemotaxis sensor kinase CheA